MYASMTTDQRNLLWSASGAAAFVLAGALFGFNGVAGLLFALMFGFSVVEVRSQHEPGTPNFRQLTPDARNIIGAWIAVVAFTIAAALFGLAGIAALIALAVAWLIYETRRPFR